MILNVVDVVKKLRQVKVIELATDATLVKDGIPVHPEAKVDTSV